MNADIFITRMTLRKSTRLLIVIYSGNLYRKVSYRKQIAVFCVKIFLTFSLITMQTFCCYFSYCVRACRKS